MSDAEFDDMTKRLADLPSFIRYLENTDVSEWQVDTVRNKGNTKNCVFGHLVNWYYGKDYEGNISPAWDWFEEMWTTTYILYEVNDGKHPDYQQPYAKHRVIAFLGDLWLGMRVPTPEGMELCSKGIYNITEYERGLAA